MFGNSFSASTTAKFIQPDRTRTSVALPDARVAGGRSQLDDPTDDAQQAAGVDVQTMMDNMQNGAQRLQGGDPAHKRSNASRKSLNRWTDLSSLWRRCPVRDHATIRSHPLR